MTPKNQHLLFLTAIVLVFIRTLYLFNTIHHSYHKAHYAGPQKKARVVIVTGTHSNQYEPSKSIAECSASLSGALAVWWTSKDPETLDEIVREAFNDLPQDTVCYVLSSALVRFSIPFTHVAPQCSKDVASSFVSHRDLGVKTSLNNGKSGAGGMQYFGEGETVRGEQIMQHAEGDMKFVEIDAQKVANNNIDVVASYNMKRALHAKVSANTKTAGLGAKLNVELHPTSKRSSTLNSFEEGGFKERRLQTKSKNEKSLERVKKKVPLFLSMPDFGQVANGLRKWKSEAKLSVVFVRSDNVENSAISQECLDEEQKQRVFETASDVLDDAMIQLLNIGGVQLCKIDISKGYVHSHSQSHESIYQKEHTSCLDLGASDAFQHLYGDSSNNKNGNIVQNNSNNNNKNNNNNKSSYGHNNHNNKSNDSNGDNNSNNSSNNNNSDISIRARISEPPASPFPVGHAIFIAGIEGSGHHLFQDISWPELTDFELWNSFLHIHRQQLHAKQDKQGQNNENNENMSKLVDAVDRIARSKSTVFVNTGRFSAEQPTRENGARRVNLLSFPFGGVHCPMAHLERFGCMPRVKLLRTLCEERGVRFSIIHLSRSTNEAIHSSSTRRHFNSAHTQTKIVNLWALPALRTLIRSSETHSSETRVIFGGMADTLSGDRNNNNYDNIDWNNDNNNNYNDDSGNKNTNNNSNNNNSNNNNNDNNNNDDDNNNRHKNKKKNHRNYKNRSTIVLSYEQLTSINVHEAENELGKLFDTNGGLLHELSDVDQTRLTKNLLKNNRERAKKKKLEALAGEA